MPSVGDSSTPLPYPILQSVVGAAAAAIEIVNASELGDGDYGSLVGQIGYYVGSDENRMGES